MGPSELKGLRLLEEEDRKLKQRVADLNLDKAMLQVVVKKSAECAPNEEHPHNALAWKNPANSPGNTGTTRIPWHQKRAKSLPADGSAIVGQW